MLLISVEPQPLLSKPSPNVINTDSYEIKKVQTILVRISQEVLNRLKKALKLSGVLRHN